MKRTGDDKKYTDPFMKIGDTTAFDMQQHQDAGNR